MITIPKVIRTSSRRRRVLNDGRVHIFTRNVLDVPATELTFQANCATIARERFNEGWVEMFNPSAVEEGCVRFLRTHDGASL